MSRILYAAGIQPRLLDPAQIICWLVSIRRVFVCWSHSVATRALLSVGRDVPAASVVASSDASRAAALEDSGRPTSTDVGTWTLAGTATAPDDDGLLLA